MKIICGSLITSLCLTIGLGSPAVFPERGVLLFGSDCDYLGKTHNFSFGRKGYTDTILYEDHISYKSKFLRKLDIDLAYPKQGVKSAGIINYIEILDERKDGTGGCVVLKSGGPGNTFATINLKSQRNHGMNFIIRIYGRPSS